jgi:hypothetical protein
LNIRMGIKKSVFYTDLTLVKCAHKKVLPKKPIFLSLSTFLLRFGGRMPLCLHLFFFIQYSRYFHTIIHPSFINIR